MKICSIVNNPSLPNVLGLFPVRLLRQHFEVGGVGKDEVVAAVMGKHLPAAIEQFIWSNLSITKQHIYLFDFAGGDTAPQSVFDRWAPWRVISQGSTTTYLHLIDLRFDFIDSASLTWQQISFAWPVVVKLTPDWCQLAITLIEKDLSAFLSDGSRALATKRDLEDADLIGDLKKGLGEAISVKDLNIGLKKLWEEEKIDALKVAFRDAKATRTQLMDSKFLIRRDDRTSYDEMIQRALLKTVFVKVQDNLEIPDIFLVDPTAGFISLTRYSDSNKEVPNVVQMVVDANR